MLAMDPASADSRSGTSTTGATSEEGAAASALYAGVGEQDVVGDMTLDMEEPKGGEALELLGAGARGTHHLPVAEQHAVSTSDLMGTTPALLTTAQTGAAAGTVGTAGATSRASTPGRAGTGGSNNVSAVYRWYEIEESFGAKRREESSVAKCKLCRQQGKLERKSCVRFSKSVTSNLWRHLKENHPDVYEKHASEKKSVQMHRLVGVKKRGRKKKAAPTAPAATNVTGAALSGDLEGGNKLLANAEDEDGHAMGSARKAAKRAKRGDQFLGEYPLGTAGSLLHHQHQLSSRQSAGSATTTISSAGASGPMVAGNFNPEKVREAMGYLCLYEMLPFELCSSHAFRNLMVECSGGAGGYVDDSNSFALFAREIAFGYAKKMAAEVKVRTVMQMKMTDFAHLMVSEWRSSNWISESDFMVTASPATSHCTATRDGDMVFLALFAVGLDQEFNPFRRCLHVSSIGNQRASEDESVVAELSGDKELKKAMERVVPCKYMPQVLAVESPCNGYEPFCADRKLQFLESVPTLLQNIMIATINELHISGSYFLGNAVLSAASDASTTLGIQNRRLDKAEFIESSSAATGSSSEDFYDLPEVEVASSILEELPTSLTGHTYRDLMNKVMYLLAHFKHSPRSRKVLRKLAVDDCGMSPDMYERVFIARLRDLAISVSGIYYVLSLVVDMMPTLKKYFALHKDGLSDFSKLVQLSLLSRYEWSRVGYLKTILKPFADATAKMDGEQYVVSSLIVPSIFTLLEKLRDSHPVDIGFNGEASGNSFPKKNDGAADSVGDLPEDIEALRDLAFANLSTSFGYLFSVPEPSWSTQKRHTFNLLWSSTILDPRTRPFIIKGPLSQQDFWDVVKAEAANIAGTKMKDKETGNDIGGNAISLDEEEDDHLDGNGSGKSGDLWDDLQANLTSCAQEEMLLSSSKSSLEITKSSNLLEVEVSFFQEEGRISLRANPLEWWQNMRMKYPFLARLARYVLSIPCNVKVNDNPVLCDGGLLKRAPCQMSLVDLCDLLAGSMNLRTEKNVLFEASSKQMWSTV